MGIHLRALDANLNGLGLLPEHSDLLMQFQFCDTGVLTFGYAKNGMHADLLDANALYLQPIIDGEEQPHYFVLDDDSDDEATPENTSVVARGALALFERAVVYPEAHSPGGGVDGLEAKQDYVNKTPGYIFNDLIHKAQARGVLTEITLTHQNNVDSNGTPWPTTYSTTYTAGTNYLQLLRNAVDNGWIELRMWGLNLELYVPDTRLAVERKDVIFRTGKHVRSGPRKRSRRGIITHMLGIGAEKNVAEVTNATAAAVYGRREGSASDGRMKENGSLRSMTQKALDKSSKASEGYTLSLTRPEFWGDAVPNVHYFCGDYVYWDARRLSETDLEPLRVRTITYGQSGVDTEPRIELELNDVFVEQSIKIDRQMTAITGGAVTNNPLPDSEFPDTTTPDRPDYVNIEMDVYPSGALHRGVATVTWAPVTENTDGSPYADHSTYVLQYTMNGGAAWSASFDEGSTATTFPELSPGSLFGVRVAARDFAGHQSAWRLSQLVEVPDDDTPPPIPSQPALSTRLGTVTITWDGKGHFGEEMPPDFLRIDVEQIGTNGATVIGSIRQSGGQGALVLSDLPYGAEATFRFRAVDQAGNVSGASLTTRITPKSLVDTDLIGEVIDAAHIVDGTIVASEKIVAESITAGQLAAGAVIAGKVAANAIVADNITAGAIKAEKLAFGTLSSNLLVNPTFEDTGQAVPTAGYKGTKIPGWGMYPMVTNGTNGQFAWRHDGDTYSGNGKAILNAGTTSGDGSYIMCDKFAVTPGVSYSTAFVAWAYVALTNVSMSINWYTAADVFISGEYTWAGTIGVTDPSVPTRVSGANKTAPANAAYARVQLFQVGTVGTATQLRVDSMRVFVAGTSYSELTAAGLRLQDSGGYKTEVTTRGVAVLNGSEQTLVRLGHGVATGMEVRHPTTGAMVPLAQHAFGIGAGATSVAGAVNLPGAASWPGRGPWRDDARAVNNTGGWSSTTAGTDMRVLHTSTTGKVYISFGFEEAYWDGTADPAARAMAVRVQLGGPTTLYTTDPEFTASVLEATQKSFTWIVTGLAVGSTYTIVPQYAAAGTTGFNHFIGKRSLLVIPVS